MKSLFAVLLVASALGAPKHCDAESPLAGTWTFKPELTNFGLSEQTFVIDKGVYKRTSCVNQIEVQADGNDHAVSGEVYFDSIRIRVINRDRVEIIEKQGNRVTWRGLYTVAPDQRSMVLTYTDDRAPRTVSGEMRFVRQGDPVMGAHASSGTWHPEKLTHISPSGLTVTFKDAEKGLTMTAGDGRSFDAKFDGQQHPLAGDGDKATVRLGRLPASSFQMNRSHGGSLTTLSRATVSADGRSMTLSEVDQNCHLMATYAYEKISD